MSQVFPLGMGFPVGVGFKFGKVSYKDKLFVSCITR